MLQSNKKIIDDFETVKLIAQNIGINKTRKFLYNNVYKQLGTINSQDVKKVYDADYFYGIVHQKPAREINGIIVNGYIDISIKYFEKISDKNIKILDYGCGAGNFVLALASLGFRVDGIDYYKDSINAANEKAKAINVNDFCKFFFDDRQMVAENYNYIVLSDFVEHISEDELRTLLERLIKYLVKGGEIIFHTPNGYMHQWCPKRSKFFDVYFFIKDIWISIKPEKYQLKRLKDAYYEQVHINIMTPKGLTNILKEYGFNDFEILYDDIFWKFLLKFQISGSFWLKCKKID